MERQSQPELAVELAVEAAGEVRSGAVYTLAEFRRRLGLGRKAVDEAKRRGLATVKLGKLCFVRGGDWYEFLGAIGDGEQNDSGRQGNTKGTLTAHQQAAGGLGGVRAFGGGSSSLEDPPETNKARIDKTNEREKSTAATDKTASQCSLSVPLASSSSPKRRKRGKAADVESVPIPEVLDTPAFRSLWATWQAHVRAKGRPMTVYTAEKQLAKLGELDHQAAMRWIDEAIFRNWQGLFEPPNERPYGNRRSANRPNRPAGSGAGLGDDRKGDL